MPQRSSFCSLSGAARYLCQEIHYCELMSSGESGLLEMAMDEIKALYEGSDPAHDFSHALRVFKNARLIGEAEGADMQVLLPAALLHDALSAPKRCVAPDGPEALRRERISDLLNRMGLEDEERQRALYAIDVHRFSKGITPETLEAKILQDADRLDAMGAIGIARVFMTGGSLGRQLCSPVDPFCRERKPNDSKWNLDHFFNKLLKLESGMHTEQGMKLARQRSEVLRRYLHDLEREIDE